MSLDPSALDLIRTAGPACVARECMPDRRGLHHFCAVFWTSVGLQGNFAPNWHSEAICRALTDVVFRGVYWAQIDGRWQALADGPRTAPRIQDLVINTPPGSGKTLITEVFLPAWTWTWDPGHRFIFTTYDATLCHQIARMFLRLVRSPLYRACYQHVQLTATRPPEGQIDNTQGGMRIAEQLGGGITGRHGHTVVGDDLIKPADASRGEIGPQLDKAWELWTQSFMTRRADPTSFGSVMIGQRLAEGDPPGRMLDQGAEHLCITARYEPDCGWDRGCKALGKYDPRTQQGESFFHERFPDTEITRIAKDLGAQAAVEAQLQQNPVPARGAYFEEQWFKEWQGLPPVWELEIAQSWDLGFGDTKDREAQSRVHGALWARHSARFLLLDEVIGTINYAETKRLFVAAQARHVCGQDLWRRASAILVEAKANGPALMSDLKDDPVLARAISTIPVLPVEPHGSKQDRAARHSAKAEAGQIWLPAESVLPSVGAFRSELVRFPKQKHNDRVDTTTQALDRLSGHSGLVDELLAQAANT